MFVVEADEYDRSFLALTPDVATVTNVEPDHLDIYADLADIRAAFEQFISPARTVVACADDAGASTLSVPASAELLTYGVTNHEARLRAHEIMSRSRGESGSSSGWTARRSGNSRCACRERIT